MIPHFVLGNIFAFQWYDVPGIFFVVKMLNLNAEIMQKFKPTAIQKFRAEIN